eukprot:15440952-Alexandrium_andersonii.AAC.1
MASPTCADDAPLRDRQPDRNDADADFAGSVRLERPNGATMRHRLLPMSMLHQWEGPRTWRRRLPALLLWT